VGLRSAILACGAFLMAAGAVAQAPAPKVPDKAALGHAEIPPHIQTQIEALMQDGAEYARLYGVPLDQAMRELQAEQDSVPATDALAREFADRLAGISIAHEGGFRIVVLLTGDAAEAPRTIAAGGLAVPVVFQTGAPATREQILAAIGAHQAEVRAELRSPPGMGVDPRTGKLVVMVNTRDVGTDGSADDIAGLAARFTGIAGVPVEVVAWGDTTSALTAVAGGGRVLGFDPQINHKAVCTSGFVVTDGSRTALSTAAHCPDQLRYIDPDGTEVPMTMIGAWGAWYQDVQIHVPIGVGGDAGGPSDMATVALPLAPIFFADKEKTALRAVTSWRNRASTRAGDLVCHRGERTGYSCAEVAYPDYAPPGDLCAGPCEPTWVAVRGPDCKGGDSGGPVFAGTIAFGLVKGDSATKDGVTALYYYMSVDQLPPGWTVAVDRSSRLPEIHKTPETNLMTNQ